MTITIKSLLTGPLLDSTFATVSIDDVRGNVYDGLTVVGYSDTVTLTGRVVSFNPSGSYSKTKLYQVELAKTSGGEVLTSRDQVWIKAASGEFLAGDLNEIALFQRYITGFPPVQRNAQDTRAIEFEWPIAGATFANSASTCKRRFSGETGAQAEALSGAITAISGVTGKYKLAYSINDRAADGANVLPTEVTYELYDDNGNYGDFVLRVLTDPLPAAIHSYDPVTKMINLIRGDSYTADLGTQISISVNVPSGIDVDNDTPKFTASAKQAFDRIEKDCEFVTGGGGAVRLELLAEDTLGHTDGDYEFRLHVEKSGQTATLATGTMRLKKDIASV